MPRVVRLLPWLVIGAWAAAALQWRRALGLPFYALSADDVFRTEHAIEAARGLLLPSDLWPPLPFWAGGALVRVGVPPWHALGVVNFVATVIALVLVVDTTRRLSRSPVAPVVAAALVVTLPWTTRLGFSSLGEPVAMAAHAAVLRGLVDWRARSGVTLVVIGLVLGGLTRYEAWGDYAVVVALAALVRREVRWPWLLLPAVYPAIWLPLQAHWFGDPLNFATSAREALADEGVAATVTRVARHVWEGADVTVVLGLVGWWRTRGTPEARAPMIFGLTTFGLQVAAALVDLEGSHTPARHFVGHGLFLAVGAGLLVGSIGGAVQWVAALALVLPRAALADWRPPRPYVSAELQTVVTRMEPHLAGRTGAVLVELDDFPSLAVPILLGERRVVWDREPGEDDPRASESVLGEGPSRLGAWMRREKVGFLITTTRQGREGAAQIGTLVESEGEVAGFVIERTQR